MNSHDIDFEGIRARLGLFWETPDELVLVALGSTVLAGVLSCAYRHVERGMNSVQQAGFSGFRILGIILWLTIACFGASYLSRRRASFNIPRLYCDRASWGMTLFCLVKIYVFLQSSQTETSSFFFAFSTFHLYFTPGSGILFLLAAPVLLWRATRIEKAQKVDTQQDERKPELLPPQDDKKD
ncbi:hypothetical protein [Acetobacter sp.]|jgi:hypothetical protein|uniref:hypothetical protein n=1 Tax=Acetobacter sp. TaxID=440 RepID=UPI0025B94A4F|nr:hypothetical protein [Acetobacter sp.]MCH4091163.1 hypothetical protein [Acetobacter sp.]MCI1301243.1 hypothetical protein [Acetobacter sp.]MCI1317575.1 hypothetical protein [Acetobacter sp.]